MMAPNSNKMSSKALTWGYDEMQLWRSQVPQVWLRDILVPQDKEILNFHNNYSTNEFCWATVTFRFSVKHKHSNIPRLCSQIYYGAQEQNPSSAEECYIQHIPWPKFLNSEVGGIHTN